VNEFDQEPMATYRRGFAQKRLSHKDDDPIELYRILDFFETVGLLVNRGYLNEEDVWNEFGAWILNIDADSDMRPNIEYEKQSDPNSYAAYLSLVERVKRIDAAHHGTASQVSKPQLMDFYREELRIVGGTQVRTHGPSAKSSDRPTVPGAWAGSVLEGKAMSDKLSIPNPRQVGVLVVDDADVIRKTLRNFLREEPAIKLLGEASNFSEAISMTAALKPDVILLDLHMPDDRSFNPEFVKANP